MPESHSPTKVTSRREAKPAPIKEKVKVVRPRGGIRTRVTRTYRKPYLYRGRKAWNHFKDLSITAGANVDSVLYLNGRSMASIPAGETTTVSGTSLRQGKYTIELKTTKGKVLDREANNRKTGL